MRVVIVSSHFPPNFVSGGTLVPFRAAAELAARGHDVHVYAGRIDPHAPDMVISEEVTPEGLKVRWTTCTSATEWNADINHNNSRVEADFARYLRQVQPDIVHLHAIQGFGGGLVSVAKAAGAAVLVTMHDLWWWCARQFLVATDLTPCCIVPSAGVCPCARDNHWLQSRNEGLAAHIRNADLVLTPSESMRKILIANGIDPAVIHVDENGAVESENPTETAVSLPDPATGVRFVFTGGQHPLKGGQVALAAAHKLRDLPGWHLDLFGWAGVAESTDQISYLDRYDSGNVRKVLSAYDVLLLPSLARESYSLMTREALQARLVVVTSDTPGPTEVIKDHQNGLVVPIGDADALADAMRKMIVDPTLLAALRPQAGEGQTSTVGQQVDRTIGHYQDLLRPPAPSSTTVVPPIRRVLLVSGIGGAPLRYRGWLAKEGLAIHGVRMDVHMYRDVEVPRLARTADALILYRVPATEQIIDLVSMVRGRPEPVPVLFDIDDLVVDPDLHAEIDPLLEGLEPLDRERYWQGVRRYRTTLEAADGYIGSTNMLCDRVSALAEIPSYRFANGVGQLLAKVSDHYLRQPRTPGRVRIGYLSGTNTHNADWAAIEPAVIRVLRERPEVELWLGGLLEVSGALDAYQDRIRRTPMLPWHELPKVLHDLDINLAPLVIGGIFNEAKSAIKHLEAALVRTPTVASPTEPFREAIDDGRTGFLASTEDEWVQKICALVDDADLRHTVGSQAQQEALLELSAEQQGRRYLELLRFAQLRVAEFGHREMFKNFEPEMTNEPYFLWAADPYQAPDILLDPLAVPGGQTRPLRQIVLDYRSNARQMLARDGVMPVLAKTGRVAARVPLKVANRLRRSVSR